MNILFINTSDQLGGAAIAAKRLMHALNNEHIKVNMLVRDKTSNDYNVIPIDQTAKLTYNFLVERFRIWWANKFSKKNLFAVSLANTGSSIVNLPEFKEADIIHLHWINQGYISLRELRKIILSGKPVVWTMHDMWPITGVCHYARSCTKYTEECYDCLLLNSSRHKDLSYHTFHKKQETYKQGKISFVGCSAWLTQKAQKSALTQGQKCINIPNPIDTSFYQPLNKKLCRDEFGLPEDHHLILFGAATTTDVRKGIQYFINACLELRQTSTKPIGIVLYGKDSELLKDEFTLPTFSMGYVKDESKLIKLYSAVDIFVLPSLEDNLPNSIMEAMSCGTPCVGFNIGGIPELIDHLHNGYVANYKSSTDLAEGMKWAIQNNQNQGLSKESRRKVIECFSENTVAKKYIELYNQITEH